ncbi:MAG: peptide chain release factor N(5)-glutamine methyltransferase [Treponema sp.]|nr:peptide chain release factor N(5)-glutamine methyltransferase [Treponema sp.]
MTVLIVLQNTKSNCIEDLLIKGKRILVSKNVSSHALDAALLLAEASGFSREKLITHNDYELSEVQRRHYFELLERRCRGESIAYILGRKEFFGLNFTVTPAVLTPRPDTEILVEAVLSILRSGPVLSDCAALRNVSFPVLDLCTGCGPVAIALKHKCPALEVWATDVSEEALAVARKNAETLDCGIAFLQGDLFDALEKRSRFFLIAANAPYVPSGEIDLLSPEVKAEPRIALDGGVDGLDLIRRIIVKAPLYLDKNGYIALEADPSQMETIAILMKDSGFSEPVMYQDLAGYNRVIAGKLS